jgi:hypothetical protein
VPVLLIRTFCGVCAVNAGAGVAPGTTSVAQDAYPREVDPVLVGIIGSLSGVIIGILGQYTAGSRSRRWQIEDREHTQSAERAAAAHHRARQAAEGIISAIVDNPLWLSRSDDAEYHERMQRIALEIMREVVHLPGNELRSRLIRTCTMLEMSAIGIEISGRNRPEVSHIVSRECRQWLGTWLRAEELPELHESWKALNSGLPAALDEFRSRQEAQGRRIPPISLD